MSMATKPLSNATKAPNVLWDVPIMSNLDGELLFDIHNALPMTQQELADFVGSSKRTIARVSVGRAHLSPDQFMRIARAVHPTNPELAARVAHRAGTTLEALGLVA